MDIEALRAIVESAIQDATKFNWIAYTIVIILSGLASFLGSYLGKKGENTATKEDIGKITDEVEKVKIEYSQQLQNLVHQNQLIIEQGGHRHQLRMAALEKRLQAHQEAYAHCQNIISNIFAEDAIRSEAIIKCQVWWVNNCLYLNAESREAVYASCRSAWSHKELSISREKFEVIENNWKTIIRPLEVLVKGVELPTIAEDINPKISR
jgi:hypothetical protein